MGTNKQLLPTWRAALALCGEPDEVGAVGGEAVQVDKETNSVRTMRVLANVAGALAPWLRAARSRALKRR